MATPKKNISFRAHEESAAFLSSMFENNEGSQADVFQTLIVEKLQAAQEREKELLATIESLEAEKSNILDRNAALASEVEGFEIDRDNRFKLENSVTVEDFQEFQSLKEELEEQIKLANENGKLATTAQVQIDSLIRMKENEIVIPVTPFQKFAVDGFARYNKCSVSELVFDKCFWFLFAKGFRDLPMKKGTLLGAKKLAKLEAEFKTQQTTGSETEKDRSNEQ